MPLTGLEWSFLLKEKGIGEDGEVSIENLHQMPDFPHPAGRGVSGGDIELSHLTEDSLNKENTGDEDINQLLNSTE